MSLFVHCHDTAARTGRVGIELGASSPWQYEHGRGLCRLLQLVAIWVIGLLAQRTQRSLPLCIDREHTTEAIVRCAGRLPVGNYQSLRLFLLVEVAPIDNRCGMFFAHPLSHQQRLSWLISNT